MGQSAVRSGQGALSSSLYVMPVELSLGGEKDRPGEEEGEGVCPEELVADREAEI